VNRIPAADIANSTNIVFAVFIGGTSRRFSASFRRNLRERAHGHGILRWARAATAALRAQCLALPAARLHPARRAA
jgi:hypothetical protein